MTVTVSNIIAFPLQQWLHECASVLLYTYIACLVEFDFQPLFQLRHQRRQNRPTTPTLVVLKIRTISNKEMRMLLQVSKPNRT